ncbi:MULTISPECIES: NusG domain II-containing protein [Clostridium]|uniref:NusG domain II-containing protein n=1 Tax=Clostridium TaxID=1485 RepID=UPI0013E8FFDE|nr:MULTISPECIES: NusG domain II-containing protein [Clostridium]MBW9156654.1 NusG domain II-containing protein [Clostridium tagluense]MBZ9625022.1 NusG domain II-containing protein [Clostridium sp. FP2]MBZ9636452.1 NusG domain II-containing protein [Clostridium sp. FP1]WLC64819.1 NusG domain II-containing protein [Clostridium tagluense]
MKKGDKIVGIVLLFIVVIAVGVVSIYKTSIKGSENIAVIKREGKVIKTIDLSKIVKPEDFTFKTANGHFNTISVKHNSISIKDADCPHKECVKSGWISKPGEMIVCLPFKLIININGQSNNSIDAGTF